MLTETAECHYCHLHCDNFYFYSCKHLNCQSCLINNFVAGNMSGLTLQTVVVTCQICKQGQVSTNVDSLLNLVKDKSMHQQESKEIDQNANPVCSKHSIEAESYCQNCGFWLCVECKKQYHTSYYPNHILLDKKLEEQSCSYHRDTKVDHFCLKCQCDICHKCLIQNENHYLHRNVLLKDKPQKRDISPSSKYQSYTEFISFIDENEQAFFGKIENDYIIQKTKIEEFVNNLQLMFNEYTNQMQEFQGNMRKLYQLIKLSYTHYFSTREKKQQHKKNGIMPTFTISKYITDITLISQKILDIDSINYFLVNTNKTKMEKLFDYKIIWNNNELVQKKQLNCHSEGITQVLELKNSNGFGFVTASIDSLINIWDSSEVYDDEVYKQDQYGTQVSLSNDQMKASINKKFPWKLVHKLEGHKSSVWSLIECNDGTLVSGSSDKTIKLWAVKSGINIETLRGHKGAVYSLMELKNLHFASGSEDKTIRIWNIKDKSCLYYLPGHQGTITCLTVLLDDCLISGSEDNALIVWNLTEISNTGILSNHECTGGCGKLTGHECMLASGKLTGHGCTVRCLLAFDDGITIASGSSDNTIKLWDLNQMKCVATMEGHENTISHLLLLKNGFLASVSWDNSFKIWDLNSRLCIFTIRGHSGIIWHIIETTDEKIITASNDQSLIIWESI